MSQTTDGKALIQNLILVKGITDKSQIYGELVDRLGIPRPTARRIASDLRTDCAKITQILSTEVE